MAERSVPFAFDEYYHIYNRGNSKQIIYKNDADRKRFMQLLYLSNGTKSFKVRELGKQDLYDVDMGNKLVAIGAYCLMPNHFHILLKPVAEGGISLFMKKLSTGYSMYFNKKYDRTGGLFEGKFKSQHVNENRYLKYLFSYIHLNPVKLIQPDWKEKGISDAESAFEYVSKFNYSSLKDYLGVNRNENKVLNKGDFPDYFSGDFKEQKTELFEWLNYQNEG